MKKFTVMMMAIMILGSTTAFAGICPKTDAWIEGKVHSDQYPVKAMGMVLDGVNRIASSPFELLDYSVSGLVESDNKLTGTVEGILHGVYESGESIVYGATNILVALVPGATGVSKDYTFMKKK